MFASTVNVQNTFISFPEPQEICARAGSEPPPALCNRYEAQVHALMFRHQPLDLTQVMPRNGWKLQERLRLFSLESDVVACERMCNDPAPIASRAVATSSITSSSAEVVVSRSTTKLSKFQARPRLPTLDNQLPCLEDIDFLASRSRITSSDDEDATVSTVSSDAVTTVPGESVPGEPLESQECRISDVSDGVQHADESMETLLKRVPRNDKGELTSVGSLTHDDGTCKPCVFAHSERKACESGVYCRFCHFEHLQKKFQKPKKHRMVASRPKDAMRFKGC